MLAGPIGQKNLQRVIGALLFIAALVLAPLRLTGDEPYARNRDYDLQHSKISLRFDIQQKNAESVEGNERAEW